MTDEQLALLRKLLTPDVPKGDPTYDQKRLELALAVRAKLDSDISLLRLIAVAEPEVSKPSIVGALISPVDKQVIVMSSSVPVAVKTAHLPLGLGDEAQANLAVQSWGKFVLEMDSGVSTGYKMPQEQRDFYMAVYKTGKAPEFRVLASREMTRSERAELREAEAERFRADGYTVLKNWN